MSEETHLVDIMFPNHTNSFFNRFIKERFPHERSRTYINEWFGRYITMPNYNINPEEDEKAAAEALKILSQNVQSEEEEGMSVWDAARMVFQGASFGTSDEIYGSIKGAIDPTMTAQEGRDEQRRLLADTKREYPKTSIALEAGGAVGTGLLAAPFTGGGSLGAGLTRAAAVGAAEGLAYGMGTSEGNIGERVLGGADEALIGVFVNPILQKTLGLLRPAARKVLTETARKMRGAQVSSKAEQELIRIIDESGVNPNDSGEVTELLEQTI